MSEVWTVDRGVEQWVTQKYCYESIGNTFAQAVEWFSYFHSLTTQLINQEWGSS